MLSSRHFRMCLLASASLVLGIAVGTVHAQLCNVEVYSCQTWSNSGECCENAGEVYQSSACEYVASGRINTPLENCGTLKIVVQGLCADEIGRCAGLVIDSCQQQECS